MCQLPLKDRSQKIISVIDIILFFNEHRMRQVWKRNCIYCFGNNFKILLCLIFHQRNSISCYIPLCLLKFDDISPVLFSMDCPLYYFTKRYKVFYFEYFACACVCGQFSIFISICIDVKKRNILKLFLKIVTYKFLQTQTLICTKVESICIDVTNKDLIKVDSEKINIGVLLRNTDSLISNF